MGQSEIVTGRLLKKLFEMREEYVVATKVGMRTTPGENGRGLSRKHVLASIDASLQRLGLDYVDLYQIHRWDPLTPIEETMEALNDVVRAGKASCIGACSMYAWQFAKLVRDLTGLAVRRDERDLAGCFTAGERVVELRELEVDRVDVDVAAPVDGDLASPGASRRNGATEVGSSRSAIPTATSSCSSRSSGDAGTHVVTGTSRLPAAVRGWVR